MIDGTEGLIAAMHTAGGSIPRLVSEWLALAQEHAALRDAFRASHGKRLPTPQKLGLWLSERMGKTAGPLRLEGRHSAKRKAWVYRVVDYVKIAEASRKEVERQAQMRVQLEESQRQQAAVARAAEADRMQRMHDAHAPPEQYEYEPQKYKTDGTPLPRKILLDPRTGEPVKTKPAAAAEPVAEAKQPPARPRSGRQPTRAELAARHRRESCGGVGGFSDPGGVVSHNMTTELRGAHGYCRVAGKWPGGFR